MKTTHHYVHNDVDNREYWCRVVSSTTTEVSLYFPHRAPHRRGPFGISRELFNLVYTKHTTPPPALFLAQSKPFTLLDIHGDTL